VNFLRERWCKTIYWSVFGGIGYFRKRSAMLRDELASYLFDGRPHMLAEPVAMWLAASRPFMAFATTYRDAMGGIVTAIEADGMRGRIPRLIGRDGWAIAEGFERYGPLAGVVMEVVRGTDDRLHYVVAGTVAEDADRVVVEIAGERQTATLADELVTASVDKGDDGTYTPEGRALAKRLPDEVRVRTFAVAFPPDALRGERLVRPVIETRLQDGAIHRQETGLSYCVTERCAPRPSRAAGPGRAG